MKALPAPVVSTGSTSTGAGDAFIGSFARYYVETRDLTGSLHKAAAYAADSITRRGTQKAYATEEGLPATLRGLSTPQPASD